MADILDFYFEIPGTDMRIAFNYNPNVMTKDEAEDRLYEFINSNHGLVIPMDSQKLKNILGVVESNPQQNVSKS